MSVLNLLLRPLCATVFIGVDYDSTACAVTLQRRRGGSVVEEGVTEYKILNCELSMDVVKFVRRIKNRYSFSYLGTISKNNNQFLIPTLQRGDCAKYGVDVSKKYNTIHILNSTVFIQSDDVNRYKEAFGSMLGLDYLFSPFAVLYVRAMHALNDLPTLYVLQERENACVFVATKREILYGSFLIINAGGSIESLSSVNGDLSTTGEEIKSVESTLDLGSDFDDLGDLEDLSDDLESLDTFDFEFKDGAGTSGSSSSVDDIQDLGRSVQIVNALQKAVQDYYKNPVYDSQFIQGVVMYDCYGMSSQVMDNIRSTFMLDISFERVVLSDEIVRLSNMQLSGSNV